MGECDDIRRQLEDIRKDIYMLKKAISDSAAEAHGRDESNRQFAAVGRWVVGTLLGIAAIVATFLQYFKGPHQ